MSEGTGRSGATEALDFLGRLRAGFPMAEIATMLMIGRPLLWRWIDGSEQPGQADVQRMLGIRDLLVEHFGDDVRTPIRVWRSLSRSGVSLGSLFSAAFIDRAAVAAQMDVLASSIANLKASEARRRRNPFKTMTGRNGAIEDVPVATFDRD